MRLAKPSIRLLVYLLDMGLSTVLSAVFFPIFYWLIGNWVFLVCVGMIPLIYFIYTYIYMSISSGYTLFSYLLHVKYVTEGENKVRKRQILLICFHRAIVVFEVIDLLYLIFFKVERGLVEKISNTFCLQKYY